MHESGIYQTWTWIAGESIQTITFIFHWFNVNDMWILWNIVWSVYIRHTVQWIHRLAYALLLYTFFRLFTYTYICILHSKKRNHRHLYTADVNGLIMVKYRSLSSQVLPTSEYACIRVPRYLCYSLIASISVILCGLVATIWAWRHSHQHQLHRTDKTLLYLGPGLSVFGIICLIIISVSVAIHIKKNNLNAHISDSQHLNSHELQTQQV